MEPSFVDNHMPLAFSVFDVTRMNKHPVGFMDVRISIDGVTLPLVSDMISHHDVGYRLVSLYVVDVIGAFRRLYEASQLRRWLHTRYFCWLVQTSF